MELKKDIRLNGLRKINPIEAQAIIEFLNLHIDLSKINKDNKTLTFKISKDELDSLVVISENKEGIF